MFVLEPHGPRPASIKSYYCLCVRHPYLVGRLDNSDITVDSKSVSRQHASLQVRNRTEVLDIYDRNRSPLHQVEETESTPSTSLSRTHLNDSPSALAAPLQEETTFLVLEVTNHSKFGTEVNGQLISGSRTVANGGFVRFGQVTFRCTYRPIYVTVSPACYDQDFRQELSDMYAQLGVEVNNAVTIARSNAATIGSFFVTEQIDGSSQTIHALTYDASIVLPTYLFEMYASLAENSHEPLHNLPHPADYEPSIDTLQFGVTRYVRPEPRTVAFSLFPQADPQRCRTNLFSRRAFAIHDPSLRSLLTSHISACGGTLIPFEGVYAVALEERRYGEGEADSTDEELEEDDRRREEKRALRARVERRRETLAQFQHLRYSVISDSELERLRTDFDPPSVLTDFDEAVTAENAANERDLWRTIAGHGWVIINQQSIFHALLTNKFVPAPIELEQAAVAEIEREKNAFISTEEQEAEEMDLRRDSAGREDVDSDATPSELGSDLDQDDQRTEKAFQRNTNGQEEVTAKNRFTDIKIHRLHTAMDRSIAVCNFQVTKLYEDSLATKAIGDDSIAFLRSVAAKCEKQMAEIELLAMESDEDQGAKLTLRQMWDECDRMLKKIAEVLKNCKVLLSGNSGAPTVFRGHTTPRDSHFMAARFDPGIAQFKAIEPMGQTSTRGATIQYSKERITNTATLRDSTRWARYFPPAPVRSRVSAMVEGHGGVATTTSQTKAHQALLISIPAKELSAISRHRSNFTRRYGEQEGEVRFHMWLTSQTPQWTAAFHGALEEKEMTMSQLFSMVP